MVRAEQGEPAVNFLELARNFIWFQSEDTSGSACLRQTWRRQEPEPASGAATRRARRRLKAGNAGRPPIRGYSRRLPADHTTIWRWVQRYAPVLNKPRMVRKLDVADPANFLLMLLDHRSRGG